jgi:hypothetical protein
MLLVIQIDSVSLRERHLNLLTGHNFAKQTLFIDSEP